MQASRAVFFIVFTVVVLQPLQEVAGDDDDPGPPNGAIAATPLLAARDLYDLADLQTIGRVSLAAFDDAFPSLNLYEVLDPLRHPQILHRMAWSEATDTAYDVTTEFDDIMTLTAAVVATSGAAG